MTSVVQDSSVEPRAVETAVPAAGAIETAAFEIAAGANPRGTVVVLGGRGERPGVYARFGKRIAFDAYPVRVVTGAAEDPAAARTTAEALLTDASLPSPKFLVGSDAGAVLALQIASGAGRVEGAEAPTGDAGASSDLAGVVVAGLPVGDSAAAGAGAPDAADLTDDATVRSACPVHQGVLADEENLTPGALAQALPEGLELPDAGAVGVPVLAFLGEADAVIDVDAAEAWLGSVPDVRVVRAPGGLHDVLNDKIHRSVAATTVLFLEDLKNGGPVLG
ncbi:hypothetical protein [Brevibacterium samyangense]|uniref:Lysophospholipase, alpha-beta hydrolase superfamily n=1 Tax=Brevibacterium samyangense TaxID=366888 RepID=A0ABN2TN69_9MICO